MPTTARADITTGLQTILEAFKAAHPNLLRATFRVRPTSLVNDSPYAYVTSRRETISHTQGTRERLMIPEVSYVWAPTIPEQDMPAFDQVVDLLVDHFSEYPHITPNTIWDAMTVIDDLEDVPDGTFRLAVRFQFTNIRIREGRS
jgi:hypothetical protein